MKKGFLVAFEGIDGCGNSTQIKKLTAHLESKKVAVHATAEPSFGPVGKLIRQALVQSSSLDEHTLALLFAADRLDHLQREIEPALAAGAVVLCDRYVLSSLAYQSQTLPMDWVALINRQARTPDLTLFLEISAGSAARRRRLRAHPESRFESLERQKNAAEAFRTALRGYNVVGQGCMIDAEAAVDAVTQQAIVALDALLDGVAARPGG